MAQPTGPGYSRLCLTAVATMALLGCQPEERRQSHLAPDSVAAKPVDTTPHQVAPAPPAKDTRFVVRQSCGEDLHPTTIWVRMMTGKPVDQYVGCRMILGNYQVRIWPGSDYVVIKADDRYGIPQMLLDYGNSKSPKVAGSIRWNVPVVFTGIEEFPLRNGSTISAAVFALEDGLGDVRYDWGGLLDIHNSQLDTLVGKSVDIADSATNPEIGDVIQRLLGRDSKDFFDRFQLVQPVVRKNGFVVGEGCKAHQCSSDVAVYAINLSTKRISIAYTVNDRAFFFGENSNRPNAMCEPIRSWAITHGVQL